MAARPATAKAVPPRLSWPGRPDGDITPGTALPPPAERHAAAGALAQEASAAPNRLLQGDNLEAMAALLPELRGRIDLIYVDPPFGSNADYVIRSAEGTRAGYGDRWAGGLSGYLEMLLPRLRLMRELLSPRGSFYIHLDATAVHYVKVLLDELYGAECFQREIIWRIGWISGYKSAVRNWARNHDTILFYTRDPADFTFHKAYVPHLPGYRRRGGREGPGHPIEDVWNASPAEHALSGAESLDSIQIKSFSSEKTGFETQKNESLLRRIVEASSSPGDLVADFFCGSGTTLVAAERLGRRWLGCDQNPAAIEIARGRIRALPLHQGFDVVVLPARDAPGEGGAEGKPLGSAAPEDGEPGGVPRPSGAAPRRAADPPGGGASRQG